MASGKLSPRQKMINLMYLVFIAMLALNMSKEVLSAFGSMNERLTEANQAAVQRNAAFLDNLATKAIEQPNQYGAVKQKADLIKQASDSLYRLIESIKAGMVEKVKDPSDYEVQDKPDYLDQNFFQGDRLAPLGTTFVNAINTYRENVLQILGSNYPSISEEVEAKFTTAQETNREGIKVDWLKYHFEGFPLIASRTKLTQLQADIKGVESEILSTMLGKQQTAALSFRKYNTLLETAKPAFYAGEAFDGALVLGRIDPNTRPNRVELTLDGRPLAANQVSIESGKVVLNITAGNAGDHTLEGNLIFLEDGEEVPVPVNTKFTTINKPNAAVISADKMNVVYRGVDNPMTISIPGIADNNVTASATGLTRVSGSKYVMRPVQGQGRTVTITARGTLPDGEQISTPSEFRIKDIPRPTGTIRGEDGDGGPVRMQRQGLEISEVGAVIPDFDFDLSLRVTGFSFKVSGQPTVKISGNKLNQQAKTALRRARRGETVQIFDINANISGNSGYKLQKISPVFIELTN